MINNNFDAIPDDLKGYRQWVVWRYENREPGITKLTKRPYNPYTGKLAEVDNPKTWGTFSDALRCYMQTGIYAGLGFVLTENDPYALIDLDDAEGDQNIINKQLGIYNDIESYAEWSPSGRGIHILVKGAIAQGRKRSKIELYSSGRYMTVTGDVYRHAPIIDAHKYLNALYDQLGKQHGVNMPFYTSSADQLYDDIEICDKAYAAENGQKFYDLYVGNFEQYYASQSEADFALINIIAFYSRNGDQTARIFRNSELGKRRKAERTGYVATMVNRAFDRILPPVDVDYLRIQLENALHESKTTQLTATPAEVVNSGEFELNPSAIPSSSNVYSPPPGMVGDIARFIYEQSPRPCAELALGGAIGLLAGVCGRAYNISGTGLNQYVLVLAKTGTGKESVASGIDKIISAVKGQVPDAKRFIGPGEIASPQALLKYMDKSSNSFVTVVGEFGLYLAQMAHINAPPHLAGLRKMILDLYNKSGEGRILGKSIYADKDKNTEDIVAPSVTILGESTPEKFYEALHEGLITEGLLPRFTMIEYHGERPPFNEDFMFAKPTFELIENFSRLCTNALNANSINKAVPVGMTPEVEGMFRRFNLFCDSQMIGANELKLNFWTRNHMKALKLAALIAVGCNVYSPTIDYAMAKWAIDLVLSDTANMIGKFNRGEIGADNDESRQIDIVCDLISEYIHSPYDDVKTYTGGDNALQMFGDKVVPYSYIHKRASRLAAFKMDKIGSTNAIKRALATLTEKGDIEMIDPVNMRKRYDSSAKAFMIKRPITFKL